MRGRATKQYVSTSAQLPRRTVVFCSFVGLAACMNLKWLWLRIDFEIEPRDDRPLDESNPASKSMKGSARRLGLTLEKAQQRSEQPIALDQELELSPWSFRIARY